MGEKGDGIHNGRDHPTIRYPPVNYPPADEPDLFLNAWREYGNLHVDDNFFVLFHDISAQNNGNHDVHHFIMNHDYDDHNYSRNVNDHREEDNRDINNNVIQFNEGNNQNENAEEVDVADADSGVEVGHSLDEVEEEPVLEARPSITLRNESMQICSYQEWFDTPDSSAGDEDAITTARQNTEENIGNKVEDPLQPGGSRKRRREEDRSEVGEKSSKKRRCSPLSSDSSDSSID